MKRLKVLVFAAATGRIGHVFLLGERLLDWGMSMRASRSPRDAAEHATKVIAHLNPDVVVTEELPKSSTKGWKTRQLLDAVGAVALHTRLLDIRAKRQHSFPNKYEEAAYLATRFPEIAAWVPKKRRLWEPEPRATVLFEALALGLSVITEN